MFSVNDPSELIVTPKIRVNGFAFYKFWRRIEPESKIFDMLFFSAHWYTINNPFASPLDILVSPVDEARKLDNIAVNIAEKD